MIQKMGYINVIINYLLQGQRISPQDHIDDLKLSFADTLNNTKGGRGADAYYISHHGN